jgi:hypothetical protein
MYEQVFTVMPFSSMGGAEVIVADSLCVVMILVVEFEGVMAIAGAVRQPSFRLDARFPYHEHAEPRRLGAQSASTSLE